MRTSTIIPAGGLIVADHLLDELDKKLERRGHKVCRYADDANICVATRISGERVMASTRGRGKNIRTTIEEITPKVRSWINYFRYSEVKGIFDELDGWLRRKLRRIL